MAPLPSGGRRGLLVLALAASANAIKEPEYNLTTGLQLEHYRQCHGGLAAMTRGLGVQVSDFDEESVAASFAYLNHTRVNWTNFCHELAPAVGGFYEVMQEGVRRQRKLLGLEVSEEPLPSLFPYARSKVEAIKNGIYHGRTAGPLDARHLTANTSGNSTVPSFNISGALPPGRLNASNIDGDAADGLGSTLSNAAEGAISNMPPATVRVKPNVPPVAGVDQYTRPNDRSVYPEGPFDVYLGLPPTGGPWQFYYGTLIPGCPSPMDNTCDFNAEAAITVVLIALEVVEAVTDALEGGDFSGAVLTVIKSAASIATNILTKIGDGQTNIDNAIQSGWTLATWANTNYIWEEVRCRQPVLMHSILNSGEVAPRGTGCDGKDSDCDWFVDNPEEDQFPPEILVGPAKAALEGKWFATDADATAVIDALVTAQDDCTAAYVTRAQSVDAGTCQWESTVTAEDNSGNLAGPISLFYRVDNTPPVVSVSTGITALRQVATDTSPAFVDVQLELSATDNCGEEVDVELTVYCDEKLVGGVPSANLFELRNGNGWGLLLQNQVFEGTCGTDGKLCLDGAPNGRVYKIEACSTDKAGNRACDSTRVSVPVFQNSVLSLLQGQSLLSFNFPTGPVALAGDHMFQVVRANRSFVAQP